MLPNSVTVGEKSISSAIVAALMNFIVIIGVRNTAICAFSVTASKSGANPTSAELVTGFHYAFAGGALFLVGGLVALLLMLRHQELWTEHAVIAALPSTRRFNPRWWRVTEVNHRNLGDDAWSAICKRVETHAWI